MCIFNKLCPAADQGYRQGGRQEVRTVWVPEQLDGLGSSSSIGIAQCGTALRAILRVTACDIMMRAGRIIITALSIAYLEKRQRAAQLGGLHGVTLHLR